MCYRVYEPAERAADNIGMVYLNQVGSSVSEDAGRDARFLAEAFNLPAIAANRPGSGGISFLISGLRRAIENDYVQVMSGLGSTLEKELDRQGIDTVIATGRSAAGLGVLALTRSERLPIEYVYSAEPVGVTEHKDTKTGYAAYKAYNKRQRELLDRGVVIKPEKPDVRGLAALKRRASMVPFFLTDKFHTERAWMKPISVRLAREIAVDQPEVEVNIDFAEHSMLDAEGCGKIEELAALLPDLRNNGAPFSVSRVPGTVHASFDNRDFYAARMAPIVDRAVSVSR